MFGAELGKHNIHWKYSWEYWFKILMKIFRKYIHWKYSWKYLLKIVMKIFIEKNEPYLIKPITLLKITLAQIQKL